MNGTYINNKKLQPGSSIELKENDKLSFGKEGSIYLFNYSPIKNIETIEKEPIKSKDYKISVIDNWKENEVSNINMTAEFQRNEKNPEEDNIKQNFDKEIKNLNETIFLKEELLHKKDNQLEFLTNENNSLKEELEKVVSSF